MHFDQKEPPREFQAGFDVKRTIRDCGNVHLSDDEQITLLTESGAEYDVTRKDFGFYMGPSLNGRLLSFNLRAVLAKNRIGRYFALLVEQGKESEFERYIREEQMQVVCWLDTTERLNQLEANYRS